MSDLVVQGGNPLTEFKIDPEIFEVATEYVKHLDINKAAQALQLPLDVVTAILDKKEVKRYIDAIFLQQGYLERNKLNDVMTKLVELKLEEMEETGLGSNKDILEILTQVHKMRMDYAKENKDNNPTQQTNIQNNFGGDNYSNLMKKIVEGGNL